MVENESRLTFLAEIASMYYDQDMNQQEIADQIGMTRSGVSRLLTEARARGIVEIIVHHPWRTNADLEKKLRTIFNLKAARVLQRENKPYQDMLSGLGVLAAQYLSGIIREDDIVGISWGTGLAQMLKHLRPMPLPDVKVIQLVGGTGTEKSSAVGPLLATILADKLGCSCHYLHAPLVTDSMQGRAIIMRETAIQETLTLGSQARIALTGIGSTHPDVYNPYKLGYVTKEELSEIQQSGAVGTICGRLYDINGRLLDIEFNHRVIGIDMEALRRIDQIIGVAGGVIKAEAILGGIRGGLINVLVTDEQAASRIIDLHEAC